MKKILLAIMIYPFLTWTPLAASEEGDHHKNENHEHSEEEHGEHKEHDEHSQHGEESFGEGKAITEVQGEGQRFKLNEDAQKLMGLKYASINALNEKGVFVVPTEALVYFNDEKGIFINTDGWFQLIEIKIIKKGPQVSQIASKKLVDGQKVVVSGTGLLRVAHLQASGHGGEGHVH